MFRIDSRNSFSLAEGISLGFEYDFQFFMPEMIDSLYLSSPVNAPLPQYIT